jgi:hypothetical protein
MRQVFVPGGQPEHTYATRDRLGLERQLQAASDNLCKLVTVTGPTKSGKSVLTKKVYPGTEAVWIDGGSVGNEEDLWLGVIEKLDGFVDITRTSTRGTAAEIAVQASAQIEIPLFAKAQVQGTPKYGQTRASSETKARRGSPKSRTLEQNGPDSHPYVCKNSPSGRRFDFRFHDAPDTVERCAAEIVSFIRDVAEPWFLGWRDTERLLCDESSPLDADAKAHLRSANESGPNPEGIEKTRQLLGVDVQRLRR